MLTGVELRAVLPGPALKQGAVDDQLGRGVQVLHDWYLVAEGAGYQGCAGTNHPGGGGLGDAVDLGEQPLGKVVPQPGSGSGAHTGTPPFPSLLATWSLVSKRLGREAKSISPGESHTLSRGTRHSPSRVGAPLAHQELVRQTPFERGP